MFSVFPFEPFTLFLKDSGDFPCSGLFPARFCLSDGLVSMMPQSLSFFLLSKILLQDFPRGSRFYNHVFASNENRKIDGERSGFT